jgi:uncharacterized protein (UPF0333 family)
LSFQVNGIEYQALSQEDYANQELVNVNSLLSAAGLPPLVSSNQNALWWSMQGNGALAAAFAQSLQQCSTSFNPATADDTQIINLLPIMGTELLPATYTTMAVVAQNTTSSPINIPINQTFSTIYGNMSNLQAYTVPATTSIVIVIVASQAGPWSIPAGSITAMSPAISGITITSPYAAIPGSLAETPAQARTRVLNRSLLTSPLDSMVTALRGLAGITSANAWYNPSSTATLTVGSIVIPERECYLVIQGYSPLIADTYTAYMNAITYNSAGALTQVQNYTTLGGQTIPVYYDLAQSVDIYVRVHVSAAYSQSPGFVAQIYSIVGNLNTALQWQVGVPVTSEIISSQFQGFTNAIITGVDVSLNGSTWTMAVSPGPFGYPLFIGTSTYVTVIVE